MQRARFRDLAGSSRTGTWTDGTVQFGGREYDVGVVDVLPPSQPTKIVCVGLNYRDHAEEEGMALPDRPMLFLKPPNAVASHGRTIQLSDAELFEFEAELRVVIGEQCRHVSENEAMQVVEGFTCVNDISNRTDQSEEQNWVRGKAFDGAAPMGPVVSSTDEVPEDATIELRVNGDRRQRSDRSELIFSVKELIAEITRYMTFEPGDVISTGTTSSVGQLHDGDTVEVKVEGVGTLRHDVEIPVDSTW